MIFIKYNYSSGYIIIYLILEKILEMKYAIIISISIIALNSPKPGSDSVYESLSENRGREEGWG